MDLFAFDFAGPFLENDFGQLAQRDRPAPRIGDSDGLDLLGIVPPGDGQANSKREAALAFEDLTDRRAAERCDDIKNIGCLDAVARELVATNRNAQHRQAAGERRAQVFRRGSSPARERSRRTFSPRR